MTTMTTTTLPQARTQSPLPITARKASLIARPLTPSRLSTGGANPKSPLQKSVSMSFAKNRVTSLRSPSPLGRDSSKDADTAVSPSSTPATGLHRLKTLSTLSLSSSSTSAAVPNPKPGRLGVLPSPPPSRTGSAEGNYSSTNGTPIDTPGTIDSDSYHKSGVGGDDVGGKEGKGNVVVSVRVRPDVEGIQSNGEWIVDGNASRVIHRGKEVADYTYDYVFSPDEDNARVYEACAKRLVRRVMEGYHGTVFAYGMTGTGKTFSMQGTTTSPGVIPLAINDIFSYIRETPHREFLLRVSYLEIYNEKIHDLLTPPAVGTNGLPAQQEEIKLREDPKRGVYAAGVKEEIVQSPTQLLRVIARGDHARRVGSTQFNARSSRSHAVVQIVVESRDRLPGGSPTGGPKSIGGGVRVSTLSLIDLAGSERAAENKERRQEGAHINRSLLTLGTVIARLSGDKSKDGSVDGNHLPYRDSKLTRLLQPALSGNSLVSILCTISIGTQSLTGETLNTLKFAARARNNIVSHAKRAEDSPMHMDAGSKALLERYRLEIHELRSQLENHKGLLEEVTREKVEAEQNLREKERHEEQMLELQLARTALKERIEHLNRLILCSKSSGVNSARNSSATSHPGHLSTYSSRSSLAHSVPHLSRTISTSSIQSPVMAREPHLSLPTDLSGIPPPMTMPDDEESAGGDFGDGVATLAAQVRALQVDLADRNRYIATLEKRLLQARRSSHTRASLGFSPTGQPLPNAPGHLIEEASLGNMLKEKDAEIAELRARLDDKDRMVAALRTAARKREVAELRTSICSCKLGKRPSPTSSISNMSASGPIPLILPAAKLGGGLSSLHGRIRTKSMDDATLKSSRNRPSITRLTTRNTSTTVSPVVSTPEADDEHSGDEAHGEFLLTGKMSLESEKENDTVIPRRSLRHSRRIVSMFREPDGGIGSPPEIGVEELGLGEIVDLSKQ